MKFSGVLVVVLAVAGSIGASPFSGKINDRVVENVRKFSNLLKLDQSVGQQFEDMRDRIEEFSKNPADIAGCFESEIKGFDLNIFDLSLDLHTISSVYYSAFPEKQISEDSIRALIDSVRDIFEKCMSRQYGTARFGFTSMSDTTEAVRKMMNGALLSNRFNPNATGSRRPATGQDAICHRQVDLPDNFDWRDQNVVTSVKNQGHECGSCWAFAVTASIESAYLVNKLALGDIDLSEQILVDCAQVHGCKGGESYDALSYVEKNGLPSEEEWPYRADDGECPGKKPADANIADFCIRQNYHKGLTEDEISRALVGFGPLAIIFNSDSIDNYRGGDLNVTDCPKDPNHAVLLVGYTPKTWILKNSWGSHWGEEGYLKLARGSNMCGINSQIAYPILN